MTEIIIYQKKIHVKRKVGTTSRGVRCLIIREGDNLVEVAMDSTLDVAEGRGFRIRDKGVIPVTKSVVIGAQSDYASTDAVVEDVRAKLGGRAIGVTFLILSRNRSSICLKKAIRGAKKMVLMLSYPNGKVGNFLIPLDRVDETDINPYNNVLDLKRYRELLEENKHLFTGVGYVSYYY